MNVPGVASWAKGVGLEDMGRVAKCSGQMLRLPGPVEFFFIRPPVEELC